MKPSLRLGHVGLCVRDIQAAAAWYQDVFGLELLGGPRELTTDDARSSEVLQDVFGPGFVSARIAQLGLDGDVGLELFEFSLANEDGEVGTPAPQSYFRPGFSHVCFTTDCLEETLERALAAGAKARSGVWHERPEYPHRFVHFEDPFGNFLELHSHGNKDTVAVTAA